MANNSLPVHNFKYIEILEKITTEEDLEIVLHVKNELEYHALDNQLTTEEEDVLAIAQRLTNIWIDEPDEFPKEWKELKAQRGLIRKILKEIKDE